MQHILQICATSTFRAFFVSLQFCLAAYAAESCLSSFEYCSRRPPRAKVFFPFVLERCVEGRSRRGRYAFRRQSALRSLRSVVLSEWFRSGAARMRVLRRSGSVHCRQGAAHVPLTRQLRAHRPSTPALTLSYPLPNSARCLARFVPNWAILGPIFVDCWGNFD